MREVPGAGAITEELHSDGFAILDLSATYDMTTHVSLQASLLNVTAVSYTHLTLPTILLV